MKIVVLGSRGMLGTDLMKLIEGAHEVVGLDIDEVDIRDIEAIRSRLKKSRPELLINAAAYTNVDGAEKDAEVVFAVNRDAARNVAAAAREIGARSIYYSSDYVFDGAKTSPYLEDDPRNPQGVYAKSKAEGEAAALDADPDSLVIRSAWLFGAHGRNFVDTMLKLAEKNDEVRVVEDQRGSPTWSWHLAQATMKLVSHKASGIFHVTGSGDVTWMRFAEKIFELAGKTTKVIPITTQELGRPAPRPAYSVLSNSKYERTTGEKMPHWLEALEGYFKKAGVIR